jgi:hypothetical protein
MISRMVNPVWRFFAGPVRAAVFAFGDSGRQAYIQVMAGDSVTNLPKVTSRYTLPLLIGPVAYAAGPPLFCAVATCSARPSSMHNRNTRARLGATL